MANQRELIVRYVVVGGCSYGVEIATLYVLRQLLQWSPIQSVAVSFWVGTIGAFVLQKLVTFRNFDRQAHIVTRQVGAYGLLVAWNYGFTLLAVTALGHVLPVYIIRTVVIVIVTCWNFIIYRGLFGKR